MVLVHQFRDTYVAYSDQSVLIAALWVRDGIYFGWNLFCDNVLIGTFDSPQEAWSEIENVKFCAEPVYVVRSCDD